MNLDITPEGEDVPEAELQTSTVSGSRTHRRSSPTSTTSKEGSSCDIPIHILKHAVPALIQGVAPALRHQFRQHSLHCLDSIHQIIQLGDLFLRQGAPALRSASRIRDVTIPRCFIAWQSFSVLANSVSL